MPRSALNRKLFRELWQLKGQIVTIALVVASGITSYIAMRGAYLSLDASRESYYDRNRFAHVFAHVERAPESLTSRIEQLPGVACVQTRITEEVALPLPGSSRPAYGRLLSLPASGPPATNVPALVKGQLPERGRDDQALVLKAFADANRLELGDEIPVVISGKLRRLRITGIALSPEFVYALRPGAIVDDPQRYAVLWMERTALAGAFAMNAAFNEVSLRLQPGANEAAVRSGLERLLAPYGVDATQGRREQVSSRILHDELNQLATLSAMVPIVFLAVAAFLVNLVLGRMIRLQRHELATLKALGYSNAAVGRHYLGIVTAVLVPGVLLGIGGGWALGRELMRVYGNVFRLPALDFQLPPSLLLVAVAISGGSAGLGAALAVRGAVKLPPAEAMRPPAPPRYRQGVWERLGLASLFGPVAMMVVREVLRRPLRTLASSLGIAGAIALLILGRFGWDSINYYFETIFGREQRQDISVVFAKPIDPRAAAELQRFPGVLKAEGVRAVPVRASFEQRQRDLVLFGLPDDASLRRLLTRKGVAQSMPEQGVVITQTLAEVLGLRVGDRIDLEVREGERARVRPVVTALLDEANGLQIYAPRELVAQLTHDVGAVSSVLLRVEPSQLASIEARLRTSPRVLDVSDTKSDVARLRAMNASFMDVWTFVAIVLSGSVIFGVNYNNARIALAARSRDLASLRVLGYSRREVGAVLLGSLAIEVGLAIPIGLWLGRAWAVQFMSRSVDPETFRWSAIVAPPTYAMATIVTLVAAAVSAWWVKRGLNDLDLIAVLKTRE